MSAGERVARGSSGKVVKRWSCRHVGVDGARSGVERIDGCISGKSKRECVDRRELIWKIEMKWRARARERCVDGVESVEGEWGGVCVSGRKPRQRATLSTFDLFLQRSNLALLQLKSRTFTT